MELEIMIRFIKEMMKSEKDREKELEMELEREFPSNINNMLGLGKPDLTH